MPKPEEKVETVEVKVVLHCKGCHQKIRKAIAKVDGVQNVSHDEKTNKFTLTGKFNPQEVIKILKKTGKQIEVLKPKETDKKKEDGKKEEKKEDGKKEEKKEDCKHNFECVCGYWRNDSCYCGRNVYCYRKRDYCWCQREKTHLLPHNQFTYRFCEDNPDYCSIM